MNSKPIIVVLAALAAAGSAFATEWEIDPNHSTVGFTVKHMLVQTVRGQFTNYETKLIFDPAHPDKFEAEATIDAASVTTNNEKRDNHLRSPDFFDVANHPTITYRARKVDVLGNNHYRVTGDLTIRGITRELVLDAVGFAASEKTPWGQTVTVASLRGTINREDFTVMWNKPLEQGGMLVSTEVQLEIDLEMTKKE